MQTSLISQINISLVPFSDNVVDDQYYGWLNDNEVVKHLYVARQDRSKEALIKYVDIASKGGNNFFPKIVTDETNEQVLRFFLK